MVGGRVVPQMSRMKTSPIGAPRTTRMEDIRALTSLPAGRVVPLAAIPLLREDALRRCTMRFSLEMMETVEVLMNAVNVDIKAYLVTNLALDRFDGMDALNRSYQGVAVEGLAVVPFIESAVAPDFAVHGFWKYLGMHAKTGDMINMAYLEAYNQIWNFRARNRSEDLNTRARLDATLAPAFWKHSNFRHIVPDFDQAVIDGEVPLNITQGSNKMYVHGVGIQDGAVSTVPNGKMWMAKPGGAWDQPLNSGVGWKMAVASAGWVKSTHTVAGAPQDIQRPDVWAELNATGITVSLSNIELARKTQAFARMKEQYQGLSDEYLIDLLMSGISVPEQAYNQPMLLGEASTIFGMSKRYSTDAVDLTKSVVNGATFLDLTIRTPPINMGGVILVTCEITPEQLFERQRDPYLHAKTVADFPDYLRDTLDPEKVEIVTNGQIDAAHATPTATFGYEPLNAKWLIQQPRIGGRYYRKDPAAVTNDADRQRIWAVETVNPTLAADFYICTNIHTKPFVVQNQDPFECVTRGMAMIEGLTVFGGALVESTGSYSEVMAKAPTGRIPDPGIIALEQEPQVFEEAVPLDPVARPDSKVKTSKAAQAASKAKTPSGQSSD